MSSGRWRSIGGTWQVRRRPPQLGGRDRAVVGALAGLFLLLLIACPLTSGRSKAEFGDPGGPFAGRIVRKTIDLPYRQGFVAFRLTVVDRAGRERRIAVPFADYRRAEPGGMISRDRAGTLRFDAGN